MGFVRAYFNCDIKCDVTDNNMCETFNVCILVFRDNMAYSIKCTIMWNDEAGYEIEDGPYKHCVNMQNQTCSYRSWILKSISYAPAIAVLHFKKIEPLNYISYWYRKSTYLKAYATFVQPVPSMIIWLASTNPPIEPPPIKRMLGRPKKKRRRKETNQGGVWK